MHSGRKEDTGDDKRRRGRKGEKGGVKQEESRERKDERRAEHQMKSREGKKERKDGEES